MKKVLSVLLVLLCIGFAFAGSFKPYLKTLDLHPAVLGGFLPTYIGVGGDYVFQLPNGDTAHIDISGAGGVTERMLFQQPTDGQYLELGSDNIQLMDVTSFEWDIKAIYEYGQYLSFTVGYRGLEESRSDSMIITGKLWPKNQSKERWLGGYQKRYPDTIENWLKNGFGATTSTTVYPELDKKSSLFTTLYTEVKYNDMIDTMVANDGFLAQFKLDCTPRLLNIDADVYSFNVDLVVAKNLLDKRFANGLNLFAISIIDRIDINYTFGSMVPSYFQAPVSLGRKIRGFNTGSYASTFTAVNNFEVRFSSPEPIRGVFLRTDFFFDCGCGYGKLFNADFNANNILISTGVQEMIDYNDAFDLGIQAAYLLKGNNATNPLNPLQVSATFFLDF